MTQELLKDQTQVLQSRREELFALHRPLVRETFNIDGTTRQGLSKDATKDANASRVRLWHSYAMLTGSAADRKLGNAIIRHASLNPAHDFPMVAVLHVWHRLRDALEADVHEKLDVVLRASGRPQMEHAPGFVGMNDNFGSMAMMVAILAGQHNQDEEVVQWAIGKLQELVDRLENDGAISEYNSPTYTPITMRCMAEIVNFSTNTKARELALYIQEQCWLHLTACYHPGLSIHGGPNSRSYMTDSCGHASNLRSMFYQVFGKDIVPLNPANTSFGLEPRWTLHHNNSHFCGACVCWEIICDYHPPAQCKDILLHRQYPDTIVARASCAFQWRPDDWLTDDQGQQIKRLRPFTPTRYAPVLLTTHHDTDFTMGSASGVLMCGTGNQEDGFFASWRRRTPTDAQPLQPEDVCTLFSRMVYNDQRPLPSSGGDLFSDRGYKTAVQQDAAAAVLYQPGNDLPKELTCLGLCLVMPIHCAMPGEIWLGDQKYTGHAIESSTPEPVFIDDGQVRICIHPAAITRFSTQAPAMRLSTHGDFFTIDLINYQGPSRQFNFHAQAMPAIRNGFVCEIASKQQDVDFHTFKNRMAKSTLSDQWQGPLRQVHYQRDHIDMLIHHDPHNMGVIPDAWIQGQPRATPRFAWKQHPDLA